MFKQRLRNLWSEMHDTPLESHATELQRVTERVIDNINQGDLSRWLSAFDSLPDVANVRWIQGESAVTVAAADSTLNQARAGLQGLIPWRKGPFQIGDIHVDSEWRSDFKWQRLQACLPDLKNRTILDVGCGNGYYMFKMAEHEPKLLIGVEPGLLHNVQFWAVEKYLNSGAVVLPLKVQELPNKMACFDVVFSMGVLYHRKSPMEHLEQLRALLNLGGQLVLETLVVEGDENTCLVPQGRYAQMRNVWFLPSPQMLSIWLGKIGFKDIVINNVSTTTLDEQRSTDWMRFHSLSEFLTPDCVQTVEGHPPPKRVIITCQK